MNSIGTRYDVRLQAMSLAMELALSPDWGFQCSPLGVDAVVGAAKLFEEYLLETTAPADE